MFHSRKGHNKLNNQRSNKRMRNESKKKGSKKKGSNKWGSKKEFQKKRDNRRDPAKTFERHNFEPPKHQFDEKSIEHQFPIILRKFLEIQSIKGFEINQFGSSIYGKNIDGIESDGFTNDLDFAVKLPEKYNCSIIVCNFCEWICTHSSINISDSEYFEEPPSDDDEPPSQYTGEVLINMNFLNGKRNCSSIQIKPFNTKKVDVVFVHSVEYNLGTPAFAHEALVHNLDSGITFSRINFIDTELILEYLKRGETFKIVSDSYHKLEERKKKCLEKGLTIVDTPDIFEDCPICVKEIEVDNFVKLDCSHKFHINCLIKWGARQINNHCDHTCSFCRTKVDDCKLRTYKFN